MRILLLTRTMLILYGATVACGGDGGTGPGAGIEGTYPLRVVNNTAVPTAKDYSWGIDTFDGGWLKLEADGTWSLEIHGGTSFDGGFPAPWTVTDSGEFEYDGETLGLSSSSSGAQVAGALDGETVTMRYDWDPYFSPDAETEFVFQR